MFRHSTTGNGTRGNISSRLLTGFSHSSGWVESSSVELFPIAADKKSFGYASRSMNKLPSLCRFFDWIRLMDPLSYLPRLIHASVIWNNFSFRFFALVSADGKTLNYSSVKPNKILQSVLVVIPSSGRFEQANIIHDNGSIWYELFVHQWLMVYPFLPFTKIPLNPN